jgi:hypothetical protein
MSSSMNDFLNTVLQMRHVMNETQQVKQEGDRAKVSALTSFIQQAQMSQDPQLMTPLIDTYANAGVASRDDLLNILRTIAPTVPALQGYNTKQGMMAANGTPNDQQTPAGQNLATETANTQLTGMNAGGMAGSQLLAALIPQGERTKDMANEAAAHAATGGRMGSGAIGVDQAMARLPGSDQTQMARIQGDLTLGARADAQNQLGWGQNRLGWAELTANSAMNHAELDAKMAAMKNPAMRDLTGISAMLTNKSGLIKELTTMKEAPPPQVLMGYIGTLNAINQSLDALGITNEGQIPFDPALMADPSAYQALIRRFSGVPTNTGASQPSTYTRSDTSNHRQAPRTRRDLRRPN